jgi:hypothetical protein
MGIHKDLSSGKEAENAVRLLFGKHGIDTYEVDNKNVTIRSQWDIMFLHHLNSTPRTIEVKNDIYALKSGNIAVEIFNPKSNKPSGLTATTAHYWIYKVGDELWVCTVDQLKMFVACEKPHRTIDVGGDNNATLKLYKKGHIFTVFTRIDTLSTKEFLSLME